MNAIPHTDHSIWQERLQRLHEEEPPESYDNRESEYYWGRPGRPEGATPGYFLHCHSWGEYVDWAERMKQGGLVHGYDSSSRQEAAPYDKYDRPWYLTPNWASAVNLARLGWHEGARQLRQYRDPIVSRLGSLIDREEYHPDVEGSDFDVAALVQGDPEHWIRLEPSITIGAGRHLRIVANISVNNNITTESIVYRGAATAALVECLEIAGIAVELFMGWATLSRRSGPRRIQVLTRIKHAGEPLDMPRLAFALAHPSSFRRLGFRYIEHWPEVCLAVGSGYGYAAELWLPKPPDIHLGVLRANWHPKNIEEFVLVQLEAQGIELRGAAGARP